MLVYTLVSIQIILVKTIKFEKPVAEKVWSTPCKKNQHVLNDCNWCWCGQNYRFQCKARVCEEVDVFGHFKDTIQEMDVGMEGHGSWRSKPTSCTPGVRYQRGEVLCICDEDGKWPNPVCRDLFRILHAVEVTEKVEESTSQNCSPAKLYLVGCNTCFCPSSGKLDATLCTNRTCSDGDPVLEPKDDVKLKEDKEGEDAKEELKVINAERDDDEELDDDHGDLKNVEEEHDDFDNEHNDLTFSESVIGTRKILEVYVSCNPKKKYLMGRKRCECLTNNRLICKYVEIPIYGKKLDRLKTSKSTLCSGKIGNVIKYGCNQCKCKRNDLMYCTTKLCMIQNKKLNRFVKTLPKLRTSVEAPLDDFHCIPGTTYMRGCNKCFCQISKGQKIFGCTLKACHPVKEKLNMLSDCVLNTSYKTDCLTCSCDVIDGEKYEVCVIDSECWNPILKESQMGSEVEIVPLQQAVREICPNGHSYKVGCNLCVCLSNGNALCTASDCSKKLDLIN